MQHGSLYTKSRLEGPDVRQFRWSEKAPIGSAYIAKGSLERLRSIPTRTPPESAVASLIAEVNWANLRSTSITMTVAQLCSHFEQRSA
jgi:hypothetical protein